MTALLALIPLAADENSAAYTAGRVVGTVVVIGLILWGIYAIGQWIDRRRD